MSARATFKNAAPLLYQSDILNRREQLEPKNINIGKYDLVAGLYKKENLLGIPTVCGPAIPTPSMTSCVSPVLINLNVKPFYGYYKVDPVGALFGNTPCGTNNYRLYLQK